MKKNVRTDTTLIGSMPCKTPEEAFELMDKYKMTIPAWPQLPKKSYKEHMVPQFSEKFPGIVIDEENKKIRLLDVDNFHTEIPAYYERAVSGDQELFAISEEYASGFHYFINTYKKRAEKIPFAKGHITGPFTFGLGITDKENKPAWFYKDYKEIIIKGIAGKAVWQIKQLQQCADKVLIFIDEPILSTIGTPPYLTIEDKEIIDCLNSIIEPIQAEGAIACIHCCANTNWGVIAETKTDIISFDAYFYGDKISLYTRKISDFIKRGGGFAWGIIPTTIPLTEQKMFNNETTGTLKAKIFELISLMEERKIDPGNLGENMLLTPSCGMKNLTCEETEKVLELLSQCH